MIVINWGNKHLKTAEVRFKCREVVVIIADLSCNVFAKTPGLVYFQICVILNKEGTLAAILKEYNPINKSLHNYS